MMLGAASVWMVIVIVAMSLACGAGNPCAKLACDNCDNKGTSMACEAIVKGDNQKACAIALEKDNFASCR